MKRSYSVVHRKLISPMLWDNFVSRHEQSWFWQSSAWLDYCLAYSPDAKDLSFAVIRDDDSLQAVAPLIQVGDDGQAGGDPLPCPLMALEGQDFLRQIVMREIDQAMVMHGIRHIAYRTCPLERFGEVITPDGWTTRSFDSTVIDLTPSLDEIWRGVTDGHRAVIHKGLRELSVARGVFSDFRALHAKVHHLTRPNLTWDMMESWHCNDVLLAFIASRGVEPLAGALFLLHEGRAYYASAASIEDSLMHAIVWAAIRELHYMKIDLLELGWMTYAGTFRKGFGGKMMPVIVQERTR